MSDRQMIYREDVLVDDLMILDGKTIEEAIEYLQKFRKQYPDDKLVFDYTSDWDHQELQLLRQYTSLENDIEYKARTDREKYLAKQASGKDAKERALYLKLKKKFEKSPVSRGRPKKAK